jgi:hypothetical protein
MNDTNTIRSDEVDLSANVYTRSGDPGRTLYSDRFPDAPVQSTRRPPGPAAPTGQPCTCAMFTTRRGQSDATCYVCGGLELVVDRSAQR